MGDGRIFERSCRYALGVVCMKGVFCITQGILHYLHVEFLILITLDKLKEQKESYVIRKASLNQIAGEFIVEGESVVGVSGV